MFEQVIEQMRKARIKNTKKDFIRLYMNGMITSQKNGAISVGTEFVLACPVIPVVNEIRNGMEDMIEDPKAEIGCVLVRNTAKAYKIRSMMAEVVFNSAQQDIFDHGKFMEALKK